MRSFTDDLGRVRTLAVNVAAVKKVRALCGLDLASVVREGKDGRPDASVLDLSASPTTSPES